MAFLKVVQGSCPGQLLELQEERVILGRHPNCQIVLDNAAVSRHHAQILESHGHFFVEDLRSRNGTQLNDVQVEGRRELGEGDTVKVCDVVFTFHKEAPPLDDTAEPAVTIDSQSGVDLERGTEADQSIGVGNEITEEDETSSIITTLNASAGSDLRLDVKPEAKLRAILQISSALGESLELNDVLQAILDGLFRIFPQAVDGFVMLENARRKKLEVKATKSRAGHDAESIPISMTIIRQAMDSGKAILSADALEDSRFDTSESLSSLRIRSMMCVPLVNKDGKALGVVQIGTNDVTKQFTQDDLDVMASVASQATLAVENAILHDRVIRQRDIERDLEFATQVQLGFLPKERPRLKNYRFADYYESAHRVGGDYFDYIPLPGGQVAIALGDVAGKGVPAALLMARLYSSAHYHLLTRSCASDALNGLNAEIASSGLGHRFVTFVLAIVDPQQHSVTFANAGHLPPILRNGNGAAEATAVSDSGMPLGVDPDQQFHSVSFDLEPGGACLLYTDGVTEAMNPENEIYGRDRLRRFLETGPADPESLVKAIIADVETFCRGRAQRDDMCLVCVQRAE